MSEIPATLSLKLPPTFENVDKVRQAVQELCRGRYRQPGSEALLGDLLLAIAEAMNNAVEHSRATEMEIEVVAGARSLTFRMLTAGAPFDPTADSAFPDLEGPEGLPEGGFGRALVVALTDRVTYEYLQGRNVLTIEKQLNKGERDGD
jgi:anti-sigma regulatory factor (Ser/Thr protein kinase)